MVKEKKSFVSKLSKTNQRKKIKGMLTSPTHAILLSLSTSANYPIVTCTMII